jgi:nitric oxide reductase subunit B
VFWAINIGLALVVLLSVLPVGLLQIQARVERGTWYARSPEFLQTDTVQTLRWLRIIGDSLFAFGGLSFGWFVLGLKTGRSLSKPEDPSPVAATESQTVGPTGSEAVRAGIGR